MTMTFDKKGKELKREARTYTVSAPPTVPPTGRLELSTRLTTRIDHDPKAVRARFVVRVSETGRIGTADLPLGQPKTAAPVASVPAPATALPGPTPSSTPTTTETPAPQP